MSDPSWHVDRVQKEDDPSEEHERILTLEVQDVVEEKVPGPLRFADLLHLAGGFGKWQVLWFIWLSSILFASTFLLLSMMFIGETPEYRCSDDFPSNYTFRDIPESASRCYRDSGAPCQQWRFDVYTDDDDNVVVETVVTKWNLVCTRQPMLSALQSAIMGGGMVGSQVSGYLGDRFGRKRIYLVMGFIFVASTLVSTVAGYYEVYFVTKFIAGFGWIGTMNMVHVMAVELTAEKWRNAAMQCLGLPFALGQITMAGLAYHLRVWWQLQLALIAPVVVHIIDIWCIPESPRWLALQGRDEEVIDVLKSIARVNGKQLSEDENLRSLLHATRQQESGGRTSGRFGEEGALSAFWRSPRLRRWSAVTALCWCTIGVVIFGLHFDISHLSDSPSVACALLAVASVPSYFVPIVLNRFGRRPLTAGSLILAGIALLLFTVKRDKVVWLVLGFLAKLPLGSAWSMVMFYTPEYLPTSVRTLGYGLARGCLQAGAMISPFILVMAQGIDEVAPSVIFGALCVVTGLLVLILPETIRRHLPQTVEEVDAGLLDHPVEEAE